MVGAHEDMLYIVLIAHGAALRAHAAAALCAVFAQQRPLHITHVRDGDDHLVVGNGIFYAEIRSLIADSGATLVTIFVSDFDELVLDNAKEHIAVTQNFFATGYEAHLLVILFL